MKYDAWIEHINKRSDCTEYLSHLTRRTSDKSALDVLIAILNERTIRGSTTDSGFIIGKNRAVCFQEIPIHPLADNVAFEEELSKKTRDNRIQWLDKWDQEINEDDWNISYRYEAFGIRVSKVDAFNKGARPVVYGLTQEMKELLPAEEHWRIVNMDLRDPNNIVDWSHEREWRVRGDYDFDYEQIDVIVGSEYSKQLFIEYYTANNPDLLTKIKSIIVLKNMLSSH